MSPFARFTLVVVGLFVLFSLGFGVCDLCNDWKTLMAGYGNGIEAVTFARPDLP